MTDHRDYFCEVSDNFINYVRKEEAHIGSFSMNALLEYLPSLSLRESFDIDAVWVGNVYSALYELYAKEEGLDCIDTRISQDEFNRLTPLWDAIEVKYNDKSIWEAFLLENFKFIHGRHWHANYCSFMVVRKPLQDYGKKYIPVDTNSIKEDYRPSVELFDGNKAKLSWMEWSRFKGLFIGEVVSEITDGKIHFGERQCNMLIPYDCGIMF